MIHAPDEVCPEFPEHEQYRNAVRGDRSSHAGVSFVKQILPIHQAFVLFGEGEVLEKTVWSYGNLREYHRFCISGSSWVGPHTR